MVLWVTVYCLAFCAKSVEIELIVDSSARILTIHCFALSVTVLPIRVLAIVVLSDVRALRMEDFSMRVYQSGDLITTGSIFVLTVTSFHENCGLNVESQGYPKMMSSTPRSVTRKRIFFSCPFVWTNRSTKWVSLPAQFVVPSMFQIFIGRSNSCIPMHRHLTNFGWIKLPIAPESTKILLSAMA